MHDDADQGVEREHAQISNAIGVVHRRGRIEDARGVVAQRDEDAGEWLGALMQRGRRFMINEMSIPLTHSVSLTPKVQSAKQTNPLTLKSKPSTMTIAMQDTMSA